MEVTYLTAQKHANYSQLENVEYLVQLNSTEFEITLETTYLEET